MEVVREHSVDPESGATFDQDLTIALHTTHSTVALSRELYWMELIDVNIEDSPKANVMWLMPREKVCPGMSHEEYDATTTREVIVL